MNKETADRFKEQVVRRATELGMDAAHVQSCSPGIRALAQMYQAVLRFPKLLTHYQDDLLVHDFRVLGAPDAPDPKFVWVLRRCGTDLFLPGLKPETFRHYASLHPEAVYFTFDGKKLERVLNLDYAINYVRLDDRQVA